MEIKETEKVAIAKPVASRPTCSGFKSFSELLAGAINASPSSTCSEAAVTAIRPRTVRFKPAVDHPSAGVAASQANLCGAAVSSPTAKDLKADGKCKVVYKPMAKLVSKTTVSLLANMRSANLFQEQELAEVEANFQLPNLVKPQCDNRSEPHQNFLSAAQKNKRVEPSNVTTQNLEEDQRSLAHTANGDRPSYDGYNWRKYGQKQVKGSEYPRSYYKCTHPNCPVKKKVERSLDGQIAEIVYKGEHSHPKTQPVRRNSSDGHWQGTSGNESNNPLCRNQHSDKNECYEGTMENPNEFGFLAHSSYSGGAPSCMHPTNGDLDNSSCHSGEFDEGREGLEGETEGPKRKRRKNDNQSNVAGTAAEGAQEPQVLGQNSTDSEIIRDGFRWRKYGQKVVKGNPYPRSYYRCTSLKCNVRKYVERTSDDPNAFMTTYEGKHNHEMPTKSTSSLAAKTSTKALGTKKIYLD
ncbi:WRKY transcription factor 44-like isoform X1 [Coffea arabica]|uniref:WRKY transcription factor 44-like isoform X1 n=1 Tax=Coffea arabica TaxID=13443 RepID=A0ABM4UT58_COFAR|nr:WRKY transcription factor 44 isoform X1 [Coffea arabica]XP_027072617.1 WRKY transcription factor 44 isoform X1 [Coffea arabica]